jgi:DNA-binding response OmpR family regulator
MIPLVPKFLIVDDVAENRFLVVKTLLRKFPRAIIQECEHSVPAISAAKSDRLTAILVHRTDDLDGVALITQLRRVHAEVPIIMLSGRDECPEAITAGANLFLNYEAWLRIGTIVEQVIMKASAPRVPAPVPITT